MATSIIKEQQPPEASGYISTMAPLIDSTKYVYEQGGYCRYGNMIFVNVRVKSITSIQSGTHSIFNNGAFPAPKADANGQYPPIILSISGITTNGAASSPYINNSGALRTGADTPAISSNTTLYMSGAYVCDD